MVEIPKNAEEIQDREEVTTGDEVIIVFPDVLPMKHPRDEFYEIDDTPPDSEEAIVGKPSLSNYGKGWALDMNEDVLGIQNNPILKNISSDLADRDDGIDASLSIRRNWLEYPVKVYKKT